MIFNINKSKQIRPKQISTPTTTWLLEIGPLVWVLASLWIKQVYVSVSLREVWWEPTESFWQWILAHPYVFSSSLTSLILFFCFVPFFSMIWRYIILLSLNLLFTSLFVADMIHLHRFADVLSTYSLLNSRMLPWVLQSFPSLIRPIHVLLFLDIAFGIVAFPLYARACKNIPRLDSIYLKRISVGLLIASFLIAIPTVRLLLKDKYGLFAHTTLKREFCGSIGLLPYHIVDLVIYISYKKNNIYEANLKSLRSFLNGDGKKKSSTSNLFGIAKGRNVILVIAESLQEFTIGLEVYGQPVTPRLTRLARESLYFVNFHDQTYLGTTSDGEFTSLQSLHPLPAGVVVHLYNSNHYNAMPEILFQHGYTTISACGQSGNFWHMDVMHKRLGFQQSFFEENYKMTERIGLCLSDREFFKQTIPILEDQKEPFMAYLLTCSSHHPFKLPEKDRTLKLGALEETTLGDYLQSVHYFDQVFGEFIDRLRKEDLLDKSILVLYGDHHSFLGYPPELAQLLGLPERSEYHDFMVRKKLPLIIRLPYGEGAGVRKVFGGHLDVAPTLLSLLGINDDKSVMLGNDLTQGKDSLVVFRDGSFTDGKYYFINRFGPASNSTCYEIATGRKIHCELLEERRREALKRLEVSDLILRDDLIPTLRDVSNTAGSQ